MIEKFPACLLLFVINISERYIILLREILFLTEGKFSISINKPIFENHKDYSFEKFELITVDLSITNCHLTKNFVSIKVDEGWFNVVLNLDLEQIYELDTDLYAISLDGTSESYSVPYEFNGLIVDIYNKKIEQIILDTL